MNLLLWLPMLIQSVTPHLPQGIKKLTNELVPRRLLSAIQKEAKYRARLRQVST